MVITKQISERKFEVELEDCDFEKENKIVIAHDYVRFVCNSGLSTKGADVPLHTVNTCGNWIPMKQSATIPIRQLVKVVLPLLNSHEYCTEKHIEGNYMWSQTPIIFYKDGVEMIALREEKNPDFTVIPYSLYYKIKEGTL